MFSANHKNIHKRMDMYGSNHGKTKRATLQKRNVIFVPKNEI